jgi:hypothetical protein
MLLCHFRFIPSPPWLTFSFADLKAIVPSFYGAIEIPKGALRDRLVSSRHLQPGSFREFGDHCTFVLLEDLTHPFR